MGIVFTNCCVLCGRPLQAIDNKSFLCPDCSSEIWQYRLNNTSVKIQGANGAVSALHYRDSVKYAMINFKFHRKQSYAKWFAQQLLPVISEKLEVWKPDIVTFPPISLIRYWERGYNQAKLLAEPIAEFIGVPCISTLKKTPFKGRQSKRKNAAERWRNAENIFKPVKDIKLNGKSVLLVDDVITTGATAASAVKELQKMGAKYVYVAAPTKT